MSITGRRGGTMDNEEIQALTGLFHVWGYLQGLRAGLEYGDLDPEDLDPAIEGIDTYIGVRLGDHE